MLAIPSNIYSVAHIVTYNACLYNSCAVVYCVCLLTQRDALHKRIGEITEVAALCDVNMICYQEAWRKGSVA